MEALIESDYLHRAVSLPTCNSIEIELKPLVRSSRKKSLYENTKNDEPYDYLNTISNGFSKSNIENSNELKTTWSRRHRFVRKDGKRNIRQIKLTDRMRYMRDFFTTMMDLNWIHMSLIFAGTYFVTWFIFAVLCYWVAYENGDFILDKITGEKHKDVCFTDIDNFLSMFLYSIGTQTTIGLNQTPSEDCAGAMILLMIQMIVSICIEGVLLSTIYLKAIAPAKQTNKFKFSDKAVICYRDDELCLLIRVCDPREQQRIESKIRVNLITDKITQEGEQLKTETELKLMNNGQQIISWPVIVCHIIDKTSPLRHITTEKDLKVSDFELYVSISGGSPSTTQVTRARTSYLPEEIFWGQRFINIIDYDELLERYVIDYSNFNTTIPVDMSN